MAAARGGVGVSETSVRLGRWRLLRARPLQAGFSQRFERLLRCYGVCQTASCLAAPVFVIDKLASGM